VVDPDEQSAFSSEVREIFPDAAKGDLGVSRDPFGKARFRPDAFPGMKRGLKKMMEALGATPFSDGIQISCFDLPLNRRFPDDGGFKPGGYAKQVSGRFI
jgi:hypothetical protein